MIRRRRSPRAMAADLKDILAIRVRQVRHTRGWTQEELADRAGISARYVGNIERGVVSASVTVLGRLARALGIDPGDFLRRRPRG